MALTNKSKDPIDAQNLQIWQNQYSNPISIYKEAALVLKKAIKSDYDKGIAYAQLNMAKACFLQSNTKEAFEWVTACLPYFYENTSEPGYVWILNLHGNMLESLGDYEKGLELCHKAFKKAKEIDDKTTEAEAASVLGLIYSRLCNLNKALDYYQKALAIREEMGDEDAIASSLNRIGMINRQLNNYHESLKYYQQSLEIRERKNLTGAIPWTLLGIASTYEEMENYTEALDYYHKGAQDLDKRCILQCKLGIGRIYSRQNNHELAEKELTFSLEIAKELDAKPLIAEAFSALAHNYEGAGYHEKALTAYKNYQKAKESVLNDEAQNRLRNVEISHAIEKSEHEKEIFRLRHVELKAAFDLIEDKNKQITSSITYARYIQQAILPNPSDFKGLVKHCCILYLPKDIISGDFYWFSEKNDKLIFTAADCTGHGVPGALMSMLGISLLNEIVNERNNTEPGSILDNLREEVIRSLNQSEQSKTKDGMDISLAVLDRKNMKLQWAGANNSLYLIRENELMEYKADHMPIGIHQKMGTPFTNQDIAVIKGDMLYLCSDGYADQFGGSDEKKFGYKSLKESFLEVSKLPLIKQKDILEKRFFDWKGDNEQIDDVLVLCYRI